MGTRSCQDFVRGRSGAGLGAAGTALGLEAKAAGEGSQELLLGGLWC